MSDRDDRVRRALPTSGPEAKTHPLTSGRSPRPSRRTRPSRSGGIRWTSPNGPPCTRPGRPWPGWSGRSSSRSPGWAGARSRAGKSHGPLRAPSTRTRAAASPRPSPPGWSPLPLGADGEFGTLVLGSARAGFPTESERLLIGVGANQDSVVLRGRRAEEALRLSEQRFARFLRHLPGLAWIKDERGRYVFANAAAVAAFGVEPDRLTAGPTTRSSPPRPPATWSSPSTPTPSPSFWPRAARSTDDALPRTPPVRYAGTHPTPPPPKAEPGPGHRRPPRGPEPDETHRCTDREPDGRPSPRPPPGSA